MRSTDWSKTPVGTPESWSPALGMMVRFLLANRFPLLLWWGPSYCQIYNDALELILGDKHPRSMGQPGPECLPEIWHIIGPLIDTSFNGGEATWMDDLLLEYTRYGYVEETHFTAAYSPVPDESVASGIGGVLLTVNEITERVIRERRGAVLRELGARCGEAKTAEGACSIAAGTLASDPEDIPFALLYLLSGDRKRARLAGAAGMKKGTYESPLEIDLSGGTTREGPWPLAETAASEAMRVVEDLGGKLGAVPPGPWSDPPHSAVVCPIRSDMAHPLSGLLVQGLSSRRHFNDGYRDFCQLVASQVATAIANAGAHEEERRRAEALATPGGALPFVEGPLRRLPDRAALSALGHPSQRGSSSSLIGSPGDGVGCSVDITEQRRVEERIRELGSIVEYSDDAIFGVTMEGAITRWNKGAEKIYGYTEAEVIGQSISILLPPELWDEVPGTLGRLKRGEVIIREARRRRKDGREIYVSLTISPIRNQKGQIIGSSTVARDVTEQKRLEGELQQSEQRFAAFMNNLPAHAWMKDTLGRYEYINGRMSSQMPSFQSNWLGKTDVDIWPAELASQYRVNDERVIASREASQIIEPCQINGEQRHFLVSKFPLFDPSGQLVLVAGVGFDITEQRRADERIRQLGAIVDSSEDAIFSKNLEGILTSWNRGAEKIYGYTETEVVGQHISILVPPSRRDALPEILARSARGETLGHYAAVARRKDGQEIEVCLSLSPIRNLTGEVIGTSTVARDVTEQKRVERKLQKSEQCFAAFMDNLPCLAWMKDVTGRYVYANKTLTEQWPAFRGDWLGKTDAELWPAERASNNIASDSEVIARRGAVSQLVDAYQINGEQRYFLVSKVPVFNPAGEIELVAGMGIDITKERGADERIREMGAIMESSGDAIMAKTLEGIITRWNKGAEKIYGYTEAEVIGQPISILIPDDRNDEGPDILKRLSRGESINQYETVRRTKDGREIQVSLTLSPIRNSAGQIIGASTVARDITEQKRVERELRESEERFREITENINEVFRLTEPDLKSTIYVSRGYETIWGRSRESLYASPSGWTAFIHPEDKGRIAEMVANYPLNTSLEMTYRIVRPDGSIRWIRDQAFPVRDASGEVIRMAGVAEDVTERRRLEMQLHQVQKMDAIGQLAAGVAHDFNNLLTVISGHSELLAIGLSTDERWLESIAEIRRATELGSTAIRQLLAFSRQQILEPKVLDLNTVVVEMEKMLRRIIGEDVRLVTKLQPGIGFVRADLGQLNQVILNLAVNARDAMPQGGRLTLETREVDLSADDVKGHLDTRPGHYVLLAVTDTGWGMAPDVQARIFEPFFSNKEEGRGTGLGLSVVLGIIQQSGGYIEVESKPGVGSKFKIYLPVARGITNGSVEKAPSKSAGGSETVLLVEDEEPVRNITSRLLKALGYRVLEAENGEEALRLFGASEEKIDLLMTDVVMPGLNGREVAEALWALDPNLKVLFESGYTDDTVVRRGVLRAEVTFLKKPFTIDALAKKVREALDQPR